MSLSHHQTSLRSRAAAVSAAVLTAAAAATLAAAPNGAAAAAPAAHRVARQSHVSSVSALPAAERAAVQRARPRPPRVTNLAPFTDASGVTLGWHDPDPALFGTVVARISRGANAPASPTSGTRIPLATRRATSAPLHGLAANRRYSAAVWTRDATGRFSSRTATTFIAPPARRGVTSVFTGSITDVAGNPLSGVVVTTENWTVDGSPARATTDSQGRYRLVSGVGQIYVSFDGSNAQGGADDSTGYLSNGRMINADAGQQIDLDQSLRRGAALTGVVTDALGNPVGGVAVNATPAYNYVPADIGDMAFAFEVYDSTAVTGVDGSYVVKGIYPDAVRACFDPTGPDVSYPADYRLPEQCTDTPQSVRVGQLIDLGTTHLSASPSGTLTGTVVSDTGMPVPNVPVTVGIVGRRYSTVGYSLTDHDGSYRIAGLRPGSYRVCVHTSLFITSPSGLGYVSRCRTAHVTISADTVSRARVTLYPGGSISGVVRGPQGVPVDGATIVLSTSHEQDWVAATDDRGRFSIPGLRSGRYRLCIDATGTSVRTAPTGLRSGCPHRSYVVRRGKARIGADFELAPAGAIRGTVTDAQGQAVRWINVSTAGYGDIGKWANTVTGRHGHFRLVGLTPGTYRLCFESGLLAADGRTQCATRKVVVRAGRVSNFGVSSLGSLGSVRATVTDAAGTPVNGVDVAAIVPCRGENCETSPLVGGKFRVAASWTTYRDGTVTLDELPGGAIGICFFGYLAAPRTGDTPPTGYADSCTPGGFDVAVRGGKVTNVHAALAVAGTVTGAVTDSDGNPVSGARVSVSGSAAADIPVSPFDTFFGDPASAASFTGPDGTYAIRSAASGEQTVCVDPRAVKDHYGFRKQCYGGTPGTKTATPVAVDSGQITSNVNVALSRRGSLAGTVTDQNGDPLSRAADVFIFRPGHPRRAMIGSPNADGTYETPGITPGTYVVCFDGRKYHGQCYDHVSWNGFDGTPLPADASVLTVTDGATTGGVDAVLQHR